MGLLKLFIKAVRKSKTIADERAAIQKELAKIRTLFRDPQLDTSTRRTNIAKLMYLYILGEKTHFGQVECIKLLASQLFADKRLGYLATMLILDENQEVLTLLTNSLDNDMQHPNAYIVGLALCCLGNIALPELARDLHANVEAILEKLTNVYLKKKAAIVAAKLIEKEPELCEYFLPRVSSLLSDKLPGVLLGGLVLVQAIHNHSDDDAHRRELAAQFPKIVGHLKRVLALGFMPDYDVSGVPDPFLQVTLLQTLRVLVVNQTQYMDDINDLLTQVASTLELLLKNLAHAVLYECVKTIFAIDLDPALKILGVNLLGKFLATRDNNCRYVALDTLLTVIHTEPQAVQRHRLTIVGCLSDGDISIRRRALELTFAILNEQNIRVLAREILVFLEECTDSELCTYITSQLTIAAAKFAPNEKWHFDTLIRMLKLAGNNVTSDILSLILALILQCSDAKLKEYVVGKIWATAVADPKQYGVAVVALWTIGEYADLVIGKTVGKSEDEDKTKSVVVSEKLIVDFFHTILTNLTYSETEKTQLVLYILTAVIKLSVKFRDLAQVEELRRILNSKQHDVNFEIQQRAVEYEQVFGQPMNLKQGLLAKMPAPPVKTREAVSLNQTGPKKNRQLIVSRPLGPTTTEDLLLDLIDHGSTPNNAPQAVLAAPVTLTDLLTDIFGSTTILLPPVPPKPVNKPVPAAHSINNDVAAIPAFSNETLQVSFVPRKFGGGQADIDALVQLNPTTLDSVGKVQLLIAVPKSQKLVISLTLGDRLPMRQTLKLTGKEGSNVKLRVKLKYEANGAPRENQFDFAGFGKNL